MERPSAVRRLIVGLLFVSVVINYLDRSSISIAGPAIAAELHLTPPQMGLVFSAFAWAYAPLQIPGSMLVDRVMPRVLYPIAIFCWSLFATLQGLTSSMWQLFAVRLGVGVSEVPTYPMNKPHRHHLGAGARAGHGRRHLRLGPVCRPRLPRPGAGLAARRVRLARHVPSSPARSALSGPASSAASIANPATAHANAAELALIRHGGGQTAWGDAGAAIVPARTAFRNRKMWGLLLAHMGETCANWFFLTWFPTYLVTYRHMPFLKVGFLATLPFLAAWAGVLLSGYLSDLMLRRGVSLSVARKLPIVTGMVLATSLIGANYVSEPWMIIGFMTLAYFGSGLAAISWSVVSSIAPVNLVGLASGAFNFVGTSMGIVVPLVIGFLVRGDDFAPALIFVGGMAVMSVLCWTLVIGKIERIR